MSKLLIVTTVAQTFNQILKDQIKFLSKNHDVYLACSCSEEQQQELKKYTGAIGVHHIQMSRGISPFRDLLSVLMMTRLVLSLKPDVIHSYTPKAGLICALSGFLSRTKIRIHSFTGLIFPYCTGIKKSVLKILDSLVCRLNTHIIAEGQGVKNLLRDVTNNDIYVIGNGNIAGVDFDYFNHNKQYPLPRSCENFFLKEIEYFTFCFIGRLNKDKGIGELLDSFLKLKINNSSIKLLVVGGLDDSNPIDSQYLSVLNNTSGIVYVGEVDDVRPYIQISDVLVLPSYREGFPNVVLQAGALAKPSIVTDICGSNEIITDGFNGWVCQPKDVDGLYEKMSLAVKSNELKQLGLNAHASVLGKFERNSYHIKLLDFYRGLM